MLRSNMHPVNGFPVFENLELRRLMAADLRSIDGTGNNLAHTGWGSTEETLIRLAKAAYADGISAPAGKGRASARAISNAVSTHGEDDLPNARHMSAFMYLWGQFIDHDLDLTNSATPTESLNIAVPKGDAYFDPAGTGKQMIGFTRSEHVGGTSTSSPRQQLNDITAFLDGSMVYGSDAARAKALRTLKGGLMKTSAGGLLPFNTLGLENATVGGAASAYFVAGDVRANENIELTAMQTLFVREHNRLAAQIAKQNPTWTDEQIYQKARKLVGGEIEAITFNEFLPTLLGAGAIAPYSGYKSNVNPGISTEFSTAAFRLGHSMLENDVEFLDNNGHDVRDELPLAQAFFNPSIVQQTNIDPILKYLASTNAEEIDTKVVDGVRNFLFGPPGAGGFDLVSLNIQRGRDHGLSDYNSTRAAMGLGKVTSFAQITSDMTLQQSLKSIYGSVDNVDLWVGGLAENHLPGSNLGPTFQRIVADQFTRVRDGDRFWYQRDLTGSDLSMVQGTHLTDVIRRNTKVSNLQANAFVFNVEIAGRVWSDMNGDGRLAPVEGGLGGWHMRLVDDTNQTIDTATTTPDGRYRFGNVQIGDYKVVCDTLPGWRATTPPPSALAVTRGMTFDHIDFGRRRIDAPPPPPMNPNMPPPPPPGGLFAGAISPTKSTTDELLI